jgi:dipeptidyl aminopeptidase/acylaminoacyl peptidase
VAYTIRDYLEMKSASALGFSDDGEQVLVNSNLTGTMQLYRVPAAGGDLEAVTELAEPVTGRYRPGSRQVLLSVDDGGNERMQIHRCEDDGAGLEPVVVDPAFIHRLGGVRRDGRTLAYAGNQRNGVDFDIYARDIDSGEERMVFSMGGLCAASAFSPDGRYLGVVRQTEKNMDSDLYLVDLREHEVIHVTPHHDESSVTGPQWLPDSSAFFFATDQEREFAAVARYEMATRSWQRVVETGWDAYPLIDRAGARLLIIENADGFTRASEYDPRTLARRGDVPLPEQGTATFALSADGALVTISVNGATCAGDVWVHDFGSGHARRLTHSPGPVPSEDLVEPELHRYTSFDGESVPVFVYRPKGGGLQPGPVVVFVHGGPEAQYTPVYHPVIQYLAASGFGVVAPNVRGSTGYGKRYHHLDDIEKRLDSVADLAALHDWLPSAGFDPARAALWGGSYGGFMVLAGLVFQPDRWAAAVDIVGITSLVTFLENTSPWRRVFREREYGSLERDRSLLEDISPLTHIDRLQAPLFVIHGSNDPRVPVSEARQLHAALLARDIETEMLVYDDEGHGLQKLKNRLDAYPKAVAFLDRMLRRG